MSPQPAGDRPTYCIRAAGVLKYNRESDSHNLNITSVLPEVLYVPSSTSCWQSPCIETWHNVQLVHFDTHCCVVPTCDGTPGEMWVLRRTGQTFTGSNLATGAWRELDSKLHIEMSPNKHHGLLTNHPLLCSLQTPPIYCCAQRQQLCETLVKQRCFFEGRHGVKTISPSPENQPTSELEDLLFRDKGMEDYNKFILDLPSEFG